MIAPWTLQKMLDWITEDFRSRDMPSARLEAEVLLSGVLQTNRIYLYTHFDRPLNPDELSRLRSAVARRRTGECTAVIVGTKEFWSLELEVTTDVLVPRPDTETIVSAAISSRLPPARVLDLCTGSGCVAIAIAHELSAAVVDATDLSDAALAVARRNVHRHEMDGRICLLQGDLFGAVPEGRVYDLIVSNPPYVTDAEMETLPAEVRMEPPMALRGGADGLDLIHRILQDAPRFTTPIESRLILEMAPAQTTVVAHTLGPQYLNCTGDIITDLSGRPRGVVFEIRRESS